VNCSIGSMFTAHIDVAIIEIKPRKSRNERPQASRRWRLWRCSISKGISITEISVGQ